MKRFRTEQNGIISDNYYSKEISNNGCIYFYGFPATLGNNCLTDELIIRNLLVTQPHYPGTYDSVGDFSPQTSIKMVEDIVLSNKEGKTYNVKNNSKIDLPEIKYVVGNSFGCFIALRSIKYLQKVKKAILFAPALTYGKTEEPSGFKESGLKFLEYVKRSRPFTYRLDDEKKWRDFYDGKMNICIDRQINTGLEEVVCVVGSNDGSFNLDELKRNYSKIINQCIGKEVLSKLIIVEGGKHSISTLLNDEVIDELNKLK